MYITIEVDNVDTFYRKMKQNKNINIAVDNRSEVWGDRHFAITDPNGVGIDMVTYSEPQDK